jgi:hypothetical protein
LKGRIDNPFVQSYGGNIAASFSAFFILKLPAVPPKYQVVFAVASALLATELFEATDGFGFMSNTYDPADYIANAAGVALAAVVSISVQFVRRLRDGANDTQRTAE